MGKVGPNSKAGRKAREGTFLICLPYLTYLRSTFPPVALLYNTVTRGIRHPLYDLNHN